MTPLRRRMTRDMQVRNFAPSTQQAYVQRVARFPLRFDRPPDLLGPEKIQTCQLHLATVRKLSPSTIAVAELRFRRACGRSQSRRLRRRREFRTTEIDDAVIAKAANIGLMRMPEKGKSKPAATGTPEAL